LKDKENPPPPLKKAKLKDGNGVSFARKQDPDIPSSIGNRSSDESPSSEETETTSGTRNETGSKGGSGRSLDIFDKDRRDAWLALLDERPDTKEERTMSVWVRKVLVVSDSHKPLSTLDGISETTDEDEEREQEHHKRKESEE
jgi:hypothetical protein